MRRYFAQGDIEAFKEDRDRQAAYDDALMEDALADVEQGRIDSMNVYFALELGHHRDYPKLKQAHVDAVWAARQAGRL